jgi:hypothetical protein
VRKREIGRTCEHVVSTIMRFFGGGGGTDSSRCRLLLGRGTTYRDKWA